MKETTNLMQPVRNTSLDLLRIIAMLMIVASHCFGHGGISSSVESSSVNYYVVWIVRTLLNVHVNCYVLISGYFLCEGKFKLRKLFSLYESAWFWSVALFFAFCVAGITDFNVKSLIKVGLPLTQQAYWFFTTYFLMYVLSPFLNVAIHAMNKKQHLISLAVFFVIYICLQNMIFWKGFTHTGQSDPLFFIFLYFVAAFIRIYPPKKKHRWFLFYIICALLNAALRFIIVWITTPIFGKAIGSDAFYTYNSILTVLGSIGLFSFFRELNIKSVRFSKLITSVSPLTFGVYLIHDNNYVRPYLWQTLIKPAEWLNSPWMYGLILLAAISVFVVCCCIEKVRLLIRKILHIDSAVNWLVEKTQNIFTKICQIKPIRAVWEENT